MGTAAGAGKGGSISRVLLMMCTQDNKNLDALQRVLCAYAVHNTSVGYCQSMNYITGMLLLVYTHFYVLR